MKDGIYNGLSWDEYRAIDAANASTLVRFADSPAHARHAQLEGEKETDSMKLGTGAHCLLWEPDQFAERYVVGPEVKRGTKVWETFAAEHPGKTIVKPSEMDKHTGIVNAVVNHPLASLLVRGEGQNEVTLIWTDQETGLKCKARLDRVTPFSSWKIIVDLKTCTSAQPEAFARTIYALAYHERAAFYSWGMTLLSKELHAFTWIAAESEPYHGVRMYQPSPKMRNEGARLFRKHLIEYAECLRSGRWDSYSTGIEELDLPRWATETAA